MKTYLLLVAAYIVPTFAMGIVWHLAIFKSNYDSIHVFRENLSVPLGLLTITIQGLVLAYIYPRLKTDGSTVYEGFRFAAIIGTIFWSIQAVAAAAKHHMDSLPTFLLLETGFFVLMFVVVGPAMAFVHAKTTAAHDPQP